MGKIKKLFDDLEEYRMNARDAAKRLEEFFSESISDHVPGYDDVHFLMPSRELIITIDDDSDMYEKTIYIGNKDYTKPVPSVVELIIRLDKQNKNVIVEKVYLHKNDGRELDSFVYTEEFMKDIPKDDLNFLGYYLNNATEAAKLVHKY